MKNTYTTSIEVMPLCIELGIPFIKKGDRLELVLPRREGINALLEQGVTILRNGDPGNPVKRVETL